MYQMNKKSQISTLMTITIPRLLFLVIVLFSIVFLIRQFVVNNLNVQDVQAEVFADRILYSPNGILYYDSSLQRTIPGIIDPLKLKPDILDSLMDYKSKNFIAANITLFDTKNNVVSSAAYNKESYLNWKPIAQSLLKGAGGVKKTAKTVFVNYIDTKLHQGYLKFEVLIPGN